MIEGLAPGERVLWEGRPQGIRGFLRSFDLFIIGFAAFAALFFVTAITGSASSRQLPPAPSEVASVALFPFIAVGLMFLLPRVIMVARDANGASYVVTDRRVILRTGRRRVELDLRTLPYLELDRSWLAGPTIFFGQRSVYDGIPWYGASPAPAFRGLPNADVVYRIIADARVQASAR